MLAFNLYRYFASFRGACLEAIKSELNLIELDDVLFDDNSLSAYSSVALVSLSALMASLWLSPVVPLFDRVLWRSELLQSPVSFGSFSLVQFADCELLSWELVVEAEALSLEMQFARLLPAALSDVDTDGSVVCCWTGRIVVALVRPDSPLCWLSAMPPLHPSGSVQSEQQFNGTLSSTSLAWTLHDTEIASRSFACFIGVDELDDAIGEERSPLLLLRFAWSGWWSSLTASDSLVEALSGREVFELFSIVATRSADRWLANDSTFFELPSKFPDTLDGSKLSDRALGAADPPDQSNSLSMLMLLRCWIALCSYSSMTSMLGKRTRSSFLIGIPFGRQTKRCRCMTNSWGSLAKVSRFANVDFIFGFVVELEPDWPALSRSILWQFSHTTSLSISQETNLFRQSFRVIDSSSRFRALGTSGSDMLWNDSNWMVNLW